jgi:hypothetical protein
MRPGEGGSCLIRVAVVGLQRLTLREFESMMPQLRRLYHDLWTSTRV